MLTKLPRLMLIGLLLASSANAAAAATPRAAWVVQQVRDHNHPYAAQRGELDTKLATMAGSAYAFYRGSDHLFYQDMATWPASLWTTPQSGSTWLGGDTHLGNFDAARDSSGKAVFKVADFDEGHLGQYVWDLRRLAASMVLAGRDNGLSDNDIGAAIDTLVGAYLDQIGGFKGSDAEKRFRLDKSNTSGVVAKAIDSADGASRSDLLAKCTIVVGGRRRFQALDNLVAVDSARDAAIGAAMTDYVASLAASKRHAASYYAVKDVRQKLGSGTGSLGRLRLYVLIEGASTADGDDVILEWKQEAASVVAIAAPAQMPPSAYGGHEGARVARTAKAQTLDAEVLIGSASVAGMPFYVHEKSPFQQDLDPAALSSPGKLATAATYLGQALASAHALADQDYDAAVVSYSIDKQIEQAASSKSGLKAELRQFAFDYAAQAQLDWEAFVAAYHAATPLY